MHHLTFRLWFSLLAVVLSSLALADDDDEQLKSKVFAPPNTVDVASTLGGGYFVDKELVNQSKILKEELALIRIKIRGGELTSAQAIKQLELIEAKRAEIAKAIEAKKILVSAFNVYSKNETIDFPQGEEKLVLITGDRIRIRPWKGPGIRCELNKIIIAKTPPDDSEFDQIKVIHQVGVASEIVGLTAEELAKEEAEFRVSPNGRKLSDEQIASRQRFIEEQITGPKRKYAPFQGKVCDQLQLSGLAWEEGNRQVSMVIQSDGGGASHSSQWRRHAKLTIYVPTSKWVLVRGCLSEVDISGIEANLILTSAGSRDRDYEGKFTVSKITGNVLIDQAPIRELVEVDGNVDFTATDEFVNHGTSNEWGTRTAYSFATARTSIGNVSGKLKARFLRTDLELNNIKGPVDVQNEFGDTRLKLEKPIDISVANRIVSESGTIQLSGGIDLLSKIPLYAYTLSGSLHSNLDRTVIEETSFSTGIPRRNWHGFVTPSKERFSLDKYERPKKALENQERPPGLDLISRGGTVKILVD